VKKVHGQDDGHAGKITLKRKTTSTAKVASTSGKAKTINVEVRKKHTFVKPNPEQIKAEALAKAEQQSQTESQGRDQVQQNTRPDSSANTQGASKAKQALEAMRAAAQQQTAKQEVSKAAVVVTRKSNNKPIVKQAVKVTETAEQKKLREAQAAQLKAVEEAARRKIPLQRFVLLMILHLLLALLVRHMKIHLRKKTVKLNVVVIPPVHVHRRKVDVVVRKSKASVNSLNVV